MIKKQITDGMLQSVANTKAKRLREKREEFADKPGAFEAYLAKDHPLGDTVSLAQRVQNTRDMILWMNNVTIHTGEKQPLLADPLEGTCHPYDKNTGQYEGSFLNAAKMMYYVAPELPRIPHHDGAGRETEVSINI